jgi:uncharacterized protein YpiB (UPF0302 family)
MNINSSYKETYDYIEWFLGNIPLKKLDSRVVLNHIKNNEAIARNIVFVDKNEQYGKYLEITAFDCDGPDIYFSKGTDDFVTTIGSVIFEEIRKNLKETLYINLVYTNKQFNKKKGEQSLEKVINKEDDQEEIAVKRLDILKEIDRALDERNKEQFLKLTNELKNSTFIV